MAWAITLITVVDWSLRKRVPTMPGAELTSVLFQDGQPTFAAANNLLTMSSAHALIVEMMKRVKTQLERIDVYKGMDKEDFGITFEATNVGKTPDGLLNPGDWLKIVFTYAEREIQSHTANESKRNWHKRESVFINLTATMYVEVRRKPKNGSAFTLRGLELFHEFLPGQCLQWGIGPSLSTSVRMYAYTMRIGGESEPVELKGVGQPDLPGYSRPVMHRTFWGKPAVRQLQAGSNPSPAIVEQQATAQA